MGMSEREHHIKVLEQFLHDYQEWGEDLELEETIKYAISSLKTDLKYDLMYEGEEVYTKADMVAMLEDLSREINPIKECEQQIFGKESWNFVGKCQDVIKQKINTLEEKINDN